MQLVCQILIRWIALYRTFEQPGPGHFSQLLLALSPYSYRFLRILNFSKLLIFRINLASFQNLVIDFSNIKKPGTNKTGFCHTHSWITVPWKVQICGINIIKQVTNVILPYSDQGVGGGVLLRIPSLKS